MTRTLQRAGAAVAGAMVLLAAACGPGFSDAEAVPPIFVGPPWEGDEGLTYNIMQRTHLYGTCELETRVDEAEGTTALRQRCIDAAEGLYHDDRTVIVNSQTLEPYTSERVIRDEKDEEQETKEAVYRRDESLARFTSRSGDDVFDATRDLPEPTDAVPEPAWYDDNSLLWLVRGIDLRAGATYEFTDVNVSTVTVFDVDLEVEDVETIEVPAGTFSAWKVRVKTRTVTHEIWVDVEAPHRVVVARFENEAYELAAYE